MDKTSSSGQRYQNEWRERFLTDILKSESEKSTHYNVLTKDKYLEIIKEVEDAEKARCKTPLQQRRLKRFNVLEIGGIKKLVSRSEMFKGIIKYYLSADELYDVIDSIHVAVGHGGRDKMLAETSKNFANITKEMVCLFLSMCEVCQEKKTKKKGGLVSKPVVYSAINSRCQVDIIDFQTQPDGKFKYVMVYQDYLTKFVLLRSLESKRADEVAHNLNDIFLTIGAPCILQSDNGREFVNNVIAVLACLWPELKIVYGKSQRNQKETTNQDIVSMLSSWLKDNNTSKWSEGLKFVQFMKNRAYHSEIKRSPYKAMFGTEPRVGLSTTSLPSELIREIQDEQDLRKLCDDDNVLSEVKLAADGINSSDVDDFEIQAKKMKVTSDN